MSPLDRHYMRRLSAEEDLTARIVSSTILFVAARPREVEIADAHEEVSSVVVLLGLGFVDI